MNDPTVKPNSRYVRAKKLALHIGVCERTVRQWQCQRIIPHKKIGRTVLFDIDEVEAAIDKRTIGPITITATPTTALSQGIQALKEEIKARRHAKRNGTKVVTHVVTDNVNNTVAT